MKRIVVGNWKMNMDSKQTATLITRLRTQITEPTAKVVVCPSFVSLARANEIISSQEALLELGAQNINDNDEGAFTGEVSGPMLKGLVSYAIVGHSERRIVFMESNELIARKVAACIRNKLTPILCVGENTNERQEGLAKRTVLDQLEQNLSEIIPSEASKLIIAYEPVWAIGTGVNAEPYDVEEMALAIYRYLVNKYGAETADKMPLLYGGSTNGDNAASYLAINKIGGLLVGGASLNYKVFSSICQL
ncbi:triose-phosphate isomerase [Patescibacteria group bacterium]|nr:triose-phosphate isomerase [Patescibacteria group bacterium]